MQQTGRRIKVLIAITRLIRGGAQREVLDLLSGLDRRRFEVTLASGLQGEWLEQAAARADHFYPVPELIRSISPIRDARAAARLLRLMRTARYHVVHTHTSKAGAVGRLAAMAARVPVIVHTPHGTVFDKAFLSTGMQAVITATERAAAFWTARIITKSDAEAEEYVRRQIARPGKFVTIHSGVDLDRLDTSESDVAAVRASLGIAPYRPIVLYAARFVPEKDHTCFLRAFETVLEGIPASVAVLAGDGPLRGEVEALAAPLIRRKALISLGFRADLPALMRAADVCVSASRTEGLPLMVLEALALGRPVVATDAGGTREVVMDGKTGKLVPCADHQALAAGILHLLHCPKEAAALAGNGRDHVRSRFDPRRLVALTEELYVNLLSSHGPTP